MKVLFDVNVVLDLLLDCSPFVEDAVELLSQAEEGLVQGYVCGAGVTTIFYMARKTMGPKPTIRQIEKLLRFLKVTAVDGKVIQRALRSPVRDFEDVVVVESAQASGVDAIVTRDIGDFKKAAIDTYTPRELIAALEAAGQDDEPSIPGASIPVNP